MALAHLKEIREGCEYDIIDKWGRYRQAQPAEEATMAQSDGARLLALRGCYAMPWLGPILRNMWAKRNGAHL